jgi:hypothetical protein
MANQLTIAFFKNFEIEIESKKSNSITTFSDYCFRASAFILMLVYVCGFTSVPNHCSECKLPRLFSFVAHFNVLPGIQMQLLRFTVYKSTKRTDVIINFGLIYANFVKALI